jgi:MoaA/NifB/PqqE/SkfB family radical SAM enzyme
MTRSICVDSGGDVYPCDPLNEPRVIQQFTSIFLVSKCDELWRVYDCVTPDGADRRMPSDKSTLAYRLFLALARKSEVRVYAFAADGTHAVDAKTLQAQLDESRRM